MEASSQFHAQAISTPGTHLTGGRGGPISDLHALERWKISCRKSKDDPSVVQPVAKSLYWLRFPGPISGYETMDVAQELGSDARWFKYDRDWRGLFTHKSVPVIFELLCILGVIREWYEHF